MTATQARFDLERISRSAARQKLAITVLAGGPSGEREVSLDSGKAVTAALESLGHTVHQADISPDNMGALARSVDCVFIALHGAFGEDGQVQEILERRGLAYTGSGPEACALAMDKERAKQRFIELGVPTPRHLVARSDNLRDVRSAAVLPVVVKPVKEGSSLHCRIIREAPALRPALEELLELYGVALVEEYIPGKEITVAVLGDEALPPIEIRTRREFYDYQAKYVDEDTEYLFDIDLPQALLAGLARMSLAAHQGLGCRDFSRLDWRVDTETGRPSLLEANVIPGLTSHSLLPKAAARTGLTMPAMCQRIIDAALRRGVSRPSQGED